MNAVTLEVRSRPRCCVFRPPSALTLGGRDVGSMVCVRKYPASEAMCHFEKRENGAKPSSSIRQCCRSLCIEPAVNPYSYGNARGSSSRE